MLKDISNEKLENDLRATEALLRDKDEEICRLSEQLIISQVETAAEIEKRDAQIQEMKSRVSTLELAVSDKANLVNFTQPSTIWGVVSDSPVALQSQQPAEYSIKIDRKCHYRGSLEAHPSNLQIDIPHTYHGGPADEHPEKEDNSLASPMSKLADSEVLEKDIESQIKNNPLKLPCILQQKQAADKAVQTLDIELTQLRRRSERIESLELQAVIEYVKLSHEYRPSAGFDSLLADASESRQSSRQRVPLKQLGKPINRMNFKVAVPDPVNHDIPVPAARDLDRCHLSLEEARKKPRNEQTCPNPSPANRIIDSEQPEISKSQRHENVKKVSRLDSPVSGRSKAASVLSHDLQRKIQKQNDVIDSFFEQLIASSNERQAAVTGPVVAVRVPFSETEPSAQNSASRHIDSSSESVGAGRGSPEGNFSVPTSAVDRVLNNPLKSAGPHVSRFTVEIKKLDSSGSSGSQRPAQWPLEMRLMPQLESLSSSRVSSSRKYCEPSAFNIRKSTTQAEASILSSPAWK